MDDNKTPPPATTLPPADDAAAAAKRQEQIEHLRNVQRIREGKTQSAQVESVADKVFGANGAPEDKGPNQAAEAAKKGAAAVAQHKKKFVFLAVGAVIVLVLIILLPLVPIQIQRSAGFAAFEGGDYAQATQELQEYLIERPQDSEAAYVLAQSAMFVGEDDLAREIINRLYAENALPDSLIGFHYVLVNPLDDREKGLQAVDQALSHSPNSVAASLLRGILLGLESGAARVAREEFLKATEAIRGADDFSDIQLLHRLLQSQGFTAPSLSIPPMAAGVQSDASRWLAFDAPLDGFSYDFKYSGAKPLLDETLSPGDVVNYYFVDMLLRQGELQEADSILESLLRNAPDSLVVAQLAGIAAIVSGDYAKAKEHFTQLLERLPDDPTTINNLATAELLGSGDNPSAAVAAMVEQYRPLASAEVDDIIALGNGAYIALIGGDTALAEALFRKINTQDEPSQVALARALLELSRGDVDDALEAFSAISHEATPGINSYLLAVYENRGDLTTAIAAFEAAPESVQNENFADYLRLLYKEGEWGLALLEGTNRVAAQPDDAASRYWLARVALHMRKRNVFSEQRNWLNGIDDPAKKHYSHALQAASAQRVGNTGNAVQYFFEAMMAAENSRQKNDYAVEWARNAVETDTEEVRTVLADHLENVVDSAEIRSIYGYALAILEEYDEAKDQVEEALKRGKGYVVNLYAGQAMVKSGEPLEGLKPLSVADGIIPGQIEVIKNLQIAYLGAGDLESEKKAVETEEYLSQLAQGESPRIRVSHKIFVPASSKPIAEKVQEVLAGNASYGDATQVYTEELEATALDSKRADIYYSQATFEVYNKAHERAARLFATALQLGIDDREDRIKAMLFYSEVLSLIDNHDQAVDVINDVIKLDGEKVLYRRLLAKALIGAGRHEQALEIYTELQKQYPATPEIYYDIAQVHANLEEFDEAIAVMKTLLRIVPAADLSAYEILTDLYVSSEQPQKARKYTDVRTLLEEG